MISLVILAGGFGTRLQSVVSAVAKPMAPVFDQPFLYWLVKNWLSRRIQFDRIVFSVGYKAESIKSYFSDNFFGVRVSYVEESQPLGTGGALIRVCRECRGDALCIVNGDTWFLPSQEFNWPEDADQPTLTMFLKKIEDVSRFGAIDFSAAGELKSIKRGANGSGWVNGGVYLVNKTGVEVIANTVFQTLPVSLEEYLFPKWLIDKQIVLRSIKNEMPFLDIGIPSDYSRAEEFLRMARFDKIK